MITFENNILRFSFRKEIMQIEPWGNNGFRVRATQNSTFSEQDWALLPNSNTVAPSFTQNEDGAELTIGKITVRITRFGKLSFWNQDGRLLLKEHYRTGDFGFDFQDKEHFDEFILIHKYARQYRNNGGLYNIVARFDSSDDEKIYGMGLYQHDYLNLKGCTLDLAQYNTQTSVPFMYSSLGYGMLWNNPGIGNVVFGKNITEWTMDGTSGIDYYITSGDTPAEILENYTDVTGRVPMINEKYLGFWQCKLRYSTQDEVLRIAHEYRRRNIPLDVIVIDFFHWTNQGDWQFDKKYWPDPKAMVQELHDMGIEVMVSVWPTVDRRSENFNYMKDEDLLIRIERGINYAMDLFGPQNFTDFTNPAARDFIWKKCKENYFDNGIPLFWLDVAEPEYTNADWDIYRYHLGNASECANFYPLCYAKTFWDGLKREGVEAPLSLIRSAWAGSQRYGALAWSGDVPSSFTYLKNQIAGGMNMGMSGMAWWTADIGGFHGGNVKDPEFHELLARWFEFGTFCPVMRLHGDRDPHGKPLSSELGGGMCASGADNEVWSYGPELEDIMTKHIAARNAMRPYIAEAMEKAHENGSPVMRPLFYNVPEDSEAWNVEDEYFFGDDLLVAPVTDAGERHRSVYLPAGRTWIDIHDLRQYEGGKRFDIEAPIDEIPLFAVKGSSIIDMLTALRR